MINLKKIISTILMTSVFCTLLICAMENHTIDEKGIYVTVIYCFVSSKFSVETLC